ncbi:ABC transporter permease [Cohnella silvisoli]|uniref:ABC transporter permease n=1 Tax=Cohnella silvisoli TaxID=2873699 RepID=A0ABV1KU25_9BACL|nr:ABC transporter permease [Cohnella silvisoli]MCD9022670.1 ABC transporter permease [Cohnella silvisoli]
MKSYGAMAGRYLKQQRRRSILTIVGIILSVALISALGTMGQALKDNMILNAKYEDGSFHIGFSKSTPELYETLKKHMLVDQLGIYRPGESTSLQGNYKVELGSVDEGALKLLPAHLQEGRLPASADELIVEQWLLDLLPGTPKLNGSAELNGPDGKPHAYRIVGIMNNQKITQLKGSSKAYTLMDPAHLIIDSKTALFLTFKPGVDINRQLTDFSKLSKDMFTNTNLLALMGESRDTGLNRALAIIFGTLVGLVVLSTVAVIYNAFHIAVLERIRQFGLLRTLGASPRQVRNLVLREATVLSVIGVPLGLLIGWSGLWLVLSLMAKGGMKIMMMEKFQLTFHWWIIGGSFVIGFLAVYLAAWLPARKASSVSPVEAVKGAGSIVRESYRRLRIPSVLSLLGIEGQMASNNIRRNRTKFRITTFSIVISIMLFIVFHYFTQQTLNLTTTTNEDDRVAFQLTRNFFSDDTGKPQQASDIVSDDKMKQLRELPGVYGVYGKYQSIDPQALVPDKQFKNDFAKKTDGQFEQVKWNGQSNKVVYSRLMLYDEARFQEAAKYVISGTADPKKLSAADGVLLIQTVKPLTVAGKKEIMPLTRYKVGDKLTLMTDYSKMPTAKQVREVTVAGILTQSPFDAAYQENSLVIIAAKPTFAKLLEAIPKTDYLNSYGTARTGIDVALKDGADSNLIKQNLEEIARSTPGSRLIDIAAEQKETRNFNLQMQIFVYSFLVIIGVIGSLNIINTVQTNLLLRRREIGLLQAVGMTMGQIRRMASAEGVWFGVIGSIWGILLGAGFSYFLYVQLSGVQGMPFEFPWSASLIAGGAALLVGLISVQGPLRRMEKANLIEELREEA